MVESTSLLTRQGLIALEGSNPSLSAKCRLTMDNSSHIPIKSVLVILVPLFGFLLFFAGYALNEKTSLEVWQISIILIGFILVSFLLIFYFYKQSLAKSIETIREENAVMNDYTSIRQGQIGNQKTTLGRWYSAAIIIALIFPFFAKIIINYSDFVRPDYVLLILGYVMIFIFIVGIIVTNRKK